MQAAEQFVRDEIAPATGLPPAIHLLVDSENIPAQKLYKKLGYKLQVRYVLICSINPTHPASLYTPLIDLPDWSCKYTHFSVAFFMLCFSQRTLYSIYYIPTTFLPTNKQFEDETATVWSLLL